jgi:hypothetical protein
VASTVLSSHLYIASSAVLQSGWSGMVECASNITSSTCCAMRAVKVGVAPRAPCIQWCIRSLKSRFLTFLQFVVRSRQQSVSVLLLKCDRGAGGREEEGGGAVQRNGTGMQRGN